jgi:DHA1 family bicyclomycin/chloramphenicol resistance-like MFS transporter
LHVIGYHMNIVILLLGLLAAFGPLSIDMYLPALPDIAKDFGSSLSSIQLSLSSFLVGIAIGQIFYGPITDRFGRKKPLYVGLSVYAVSSFFCATTSSVDGLIFFRFMQALGSCAGMVISRAIVRDLYRPHESAKIFSLLMLIMGVAPILAPVAGGYLSLAFGWRSIFWILLGISLITLVLIYSFMPETHVKDENYSFKRVFGNYLEILKDKQFTGYTFSLSFIYAGMFAYITGSAFVFIEHYGLTPGQYSMVFGTNAFGLIFFSQVNGKLLRKFTPEYLINFTLPWTVMSGLFILAVGLTNGPLWAMCLALFFYILTMGIIAPNSAACALAKQKKLSGSASALMGTIQFTVAGLCSSLVSHLHDDSIRPMSVVICVVGVTAYFIYWLLVSRKETEISI